MTRRPQRWQAEKARTAKALKALPPCETPGCKKSGRGFTLYGYWRCTEHAVLEMRSWGAQRAQREKSHA